MRTLLVILMSALIASAIAQGTLELEPNHGPVGTEVVATAAGLEPGTDVELVWMSADASWNVGDGEFHGIAATERRDVLATATVAADGRAVMAFTAPEDFGYVHNLFVEAGGTQLARQGFTLVPDMTISPTSGPIGTPITVRMTGVGYRFWESVWHLMYDGAHTGWMSAITSRGTAEIVIPATGEVGLHTLQAMSGTHPVPYLNQQQSPNYKPVVPTVIGALFEVTDGAAVLPPAPAEQTLPRLAAAPPAESGAPAVWTDFRSGPVGSPVTVSGRGFPADAAVELRWSTVTGNRISGAGWEERESVLAEVTADEGGAWSLTFDTPDDLGGDHRLSAVAEGAAAETVYVVTPSVTEVTPRVVEPGGDITVTIKGVGWTETANIYTLLLDNGYLGYGCGFNSQGDVTIHLKAPGREGVHFIGIFPSIYQGEVIAPGGPSTPDANATWLQLPMLHHQDHPGETLPAFHLSFEVRAP